MRTPDVRGRGKLNADKEVKNWQNLPDVFYGWPLRFKEEYRLGYELGYGLGFGLGYRLGCRFGLICRCRILGV